MISIIFNFQSCKNMENRIDEKSERDPLAPKKRFGFSGL